jgi:hypothetical protein
LGNFTNGDSNQVICRHFRVPTIFAMNSIINANVAYGGQSSNDVDTDDPAYDDNGYELPPEDLPACTLPPAYLDALDSGKNYFGDLSNFIDQNGEFNPDMYWNQMLTSFSPNNDFSYVLLDVEETIKNRAQAIADENERDVDRGNGVMSIRKCERINENGYSVEQGRQDCYSKYHQCTQNSSPESCEAKKRSCLAKYARGGRIVCHYTTPGAVVENEIAETVGTERRSVELADTFNELIFALIGQLLAAIFQKDDGLSGTVTYDVDPDA